MDGGLQIDEARARTRAPPAVQRPEQKAFICGTCQSRTCCYHYRVAITGLDMWRISRTLDVPPERFVTYVRVAGVEPHYFALDAGEARFQLVLAKTTEPRRQGGCVFLVRTNGGAHRCGLGDLKPEQCSSYPAYVQNGIVRVVNDRRGCWRGWSVNELDVSKELRRSEDYEIHKSEYAEVVAEWNRKVLAAGDRVFSFTEFCNHVENRYADLYPPGG